MGTDIFGAGDTM